MKNVLLELSERGCIHNASHFEELSHLMEKEKVCFYAGFDPTAASLHVGHMLPLFLMRRLQQAGHKPIAVVGSATGMIGDPSGKSQERKLLDEELILHNVSGIEEQIKIFLSSHGDNSYLLLRNDSWLGSLKMIDFLRDYGKHFSVNSMIAKESVKNRLENREQGISYTEFSYMLLQAYDYYYLNKTFNCRLQVGGSDQWGNITAGMELIRRKNIETHPQVYGLTFPLITTSSGVKFGKTEQGAVWLSSDMTSPYQFYQYWMNTSDADVIKYLLLFSDISIDLITSLQVSIKEKPEERLAQRALADFITSLIHGDASCKQAQHASSVLFSGDIRGLSSDELLDIFNDVPSCPVLFENADDKLGIVDVIIKAKLAESKSAARRLIENGGVYLNNEKVSDVGMKIRLQHFIDEKVIVLRSGKKKYSLVKLAR